MRVVEHEKETTVLAYRVIKGAGIVAGVFSLVVCALLIANNRSDTWIMLGIVLLNYAAAIVCATIFNNCEFFVFVS